MTQVYRVRFSSKVDASAWVRPAAQCQDIEDDLESIHNRLPAESEILSIENLSTGELVHWTRWPKTYRPGFGG